MQTVYIMIGIPGAGKTTYAKTKLAHAAYLGTDAIREELFGKELTLRGHKRVHQIMHERMLHYLEEGRDVVIDCTNITRKRRKILLNVIPPGHQIVALFMDTPLLQALKNNRSRKRHVPMIGIFSMKRNLCAPELEEGFTQIYHIRPQYVKEKDKIELVVVEEIDV